MPEESTTKFRVTITETLKRTVEVEADDPDQAEQMVADGWHSSKYILGADDFAGVEFSAAGGITDTQPRSSNQFSAIAI